MDELQKLRRAKDYLEQLSNGVNPISRQPLPEFSGPDGQRLRNCFTFVARILGRVIENGGKVGRAAREKKETFSISIQQLSQVEISDTPVSLNAFVQRVNAAAKLEGNRKKLTRTPITAWLLKKGFLQRACGINGGHIHIPTIKAETIGISRAPAHNAEGRPYWANLYARDAQKFLLDHLQEILAGQGQKENEEGNLPDS